MLSHFEELELNEISKKILFSISNLNTFENISSILTDKIFIDSNKKLLSLLKINLSPFHLRIFLTHIIIKHCPNEIMQTITSTEEKLIDLSNNMHDKYLEMLKENKYCDNIKDIIQNFINEFLVWKESDEKKLLFTISSSYNELIMTSNLLEKNNDDDSRLWIAEIEKQKKILEKSVYKIGGEKAIEKMIDGSFWLDVLTPDFKNMVNNNLKESFRKKLLDELENNLIPFTIIKCLKEISNFIGNQKITKNLKIEMLNMELNQGDKMNIIKYNLNILAAHFIIDPKDYETIDLLLVLYNKINLI